MKVSQATTQIQDTRKTYMIRVVFYLSILYFFDVLLCLFYLLPLYCDVFWKDFCLNTLSFFYTSDSFSQIFIDIAFCLIATLIFSIGALIISYKNNIAYQDEYMRLIYNELELNSIYLVKQKKVEENADMDFIYKTLNINNLEREHLYTFESLFNMNFYQLFPLIHHKKDYSLLISSKVEKGIDGFIQIRLNTDYTIDNYENKNIYQYNFSDTRKYSYDIYVNSSMSKETYKIIDDNVLKTMIQLKKFTSVNLVVTITKDLYYVWIPGWEMKLTDSLFKKLSYDKMDKKIEVFTELIDEVIDLYIYLVNKEDYK